MTEAYAEALRAQLALLRYALEGASPRRALAVYVAANHRARVPIVAQIVYVELASVSPNLLYIFFRHFVTLLRDDLVRGFYPVRSIKVHQLGGEVQASGSLHVVSHDEAAASALWPKPDEGHFSRAALLHA